MCYSNCILYLLYDNLKLSVIFVLVLFWSSTPHNSPSIKGPSVPTSSMSSPVTSVGIGVPAIQNRPSVSNTQLQNPSPAHVRINTFLFWEHNISICFSTI